MFNIYIILCVCVGFHWVLQFPQGVLKADVIWFLLEKSHIIGV